MGKHILFIEDDTFLVEILQQFLARAGFQVIIAHNGEEALEQLTTVTPDLILLDLLLPQLDGFGVLEKIRAKQETASVPVIILSNLSDQENVKRGATLGVSAYLIKASTVPEEIVKKIKEVLHMP